MAIADDAVPTKRWTAFEPLRERTFRRIWSASVLSNFGQLIQGVGAAWEMTRLTSSPSMVALVQTALMLPLMLVAVPAGAIADMFDRRRIALAGLTFATISALTLTGISMLNLTTPWVLLCFSSLIGVGVALYGPAWQASVSEQVKPEQLPAAVGLASVSYNIARSFGPAIGGLIVLAAGATAAFAVNALMYLPLIVAFFLWRREHVPARLPPERLDRAIISGARYAIHSPPIRIVLIRALALGLAAASISALTPLVARDLLAGNASTFGLLLGANGVGAVIGALVVSEVRNRLKAEHAVRLCAIVASVMIVIIALSNNVIVTALALAVAGAAYMLNIALLNVAVQLSAPRWVTARAIAWFQASLTGGIAIGAWIWGVVASDWDVSNALIASGITLLLTPLIGLLLPMPPISTADVEMVELANEPEVALALTARSGPIVIEIDYRVNPDAARQFYDVMLKMQRTRLRNGAFDWSLSRDIADPELWTERYHCPTWADYLRLRSRFTHADRELQTLADAYHIAGPGHRVRRRLERPFGSVRWRAETPDPNRDPISIYTP
ncbi:MFS transporter [Steroidobacter agaridevorans]|uniref:MFS transporter n=1 Tax=Steroidobacter agaridevorans TaxID=2695856 RepID=UPI00132AA8DF|nr:MFS transporter [Steroidobacter agaridevorans]GFE90676.1 MFS transporter [Steroidobacter agaridevorans]